MRPHPTLLLMATACGAAPSTPRVNPEVARPETVAPLMLPAQAFAWPDAGWRGQGLVAARSAETPTLLGGPAGLFAVRDGALAPVAAAAVAGLAAHAPDGVVVAGADGVAVHATTLAPSPLSDALGGAAVTALAAQGDALWLGTAQALYRWQDGLLISLELPDVRSLHAHGDAVVARSGAALYRLTPDGAGFRQVDLTAERPLDDAFPLSDGDVLGLSQGVLLRRSAGTDGVVWSPQALGPDDAGADGVVAAAQDPVRGAVWLARADGLHRLEGPQVALQPALPDLPTALAVDEDGAVWAASPEALTRVGQDRPPVTWQGEVAAFAAANCTRCHKPLGNAHPLETFEAWRGELDAILAALEAGRMPLDQAPLTAGSVETIRRWKEDGLLY
jgi:hypothetical protein